MTTTIGIGLTHRPATRRTRTVLSGNRSRYDQRRRLDEQTPEDLAWWELVGQDPCWACGARPEDARNGVNDRDHIVALDAGGENRWTNVSAACPRCNRGRRATSVLHFLLRRSGSCSPSLTSGA